VDGEAGADLEALQLRRPRQLQLTVTHLADLEELLLQVGVYVALHVKNAILPECESLSVLYLYGAPGNACTLCFH